MKVQMAFQNEHGAALVISLMFLAILAMLGTTAVVMTTTDMQIGRNYKESTQAFFDADAGVNYALNRIKAGVSAGSFSLPSNVGGTSALSYTTPSGFSFSISDITKISNNAYSFTSTGSGPDNAQAIINAIFSTLGVFNYGIFGDLGVTLSGNGRTDSYNSSDGPYTWATHNTEGDVGTNATSAGAISLSGNAKVYGDAVLGPGGDPATGVTTTGNAEVVPPGQKLAADEPKDMTPYFEPDSGIWTPISAWNVTGGTDDPAYAGTYQIPSISISGNGTGIISGGATFHVSGNISISGNGKLIIEPGNAVTIYATGSVSITGNGKLILQTDPTDPIDGESSMKLFASGAVTIAGNGISNDSYKPERLQIYGGSTCNSVNISGNGNIYGAIYAPAANVSVPGNGDIYGSVIGSAINISGNGNIHYDEALQDVGPTTGLKMVSWEHRS